MLLSLHEALYIQSQRTRHLYVLLADLTSAADLLCWICQSIAALRMPHQQMAFTPDQPYAEQGLASPDIREDFSGLCFEHGFDPQGLLDRLGSFLPADTLEEFMDDLAMGRV